MNGSCPSNRHNRKAWQSKSLSRSTGVCGFYTGRDQAAIALSEIYAGKSLINLQRPWLFGLRVDMAPIVKAKCRIAILLNLEDNNIVAQRVNRSPLG